MKKLFTGQIHQWYQWYLHKDGIGHNATNSLLFLTTTREKYVKMYKRFTEQLRMYANAIRLLSKG